MERIAAGRAVAGKPLFTEKRFYVLLAFVTSLFLLWGIAITMGDVLNRHFQNVLHVSKAQSGLVGRVLYVTGGAAVFLAGLVMLFVPGPGMLAMLVGAGLLADQSLLVARALDWLELSARRTIRRRR